jgi:hypothetical protein
MRGLVYKKLLSFVEQDFAALACSCDMNQCPCCMARATLAAQALAKPPTTMFWTIDRVPTGYFPYDEPTGL